MIWDESGWEKPESLHLDDLGPTRSSQAARLTHIKPGYYSPPRGPIFVPGMQWLAVLLIGRLTKPGPPLLAAQRWWTNRGPHTSYKRDERSASCWWNWRLGWGRAVIHVFDQGEAFAFWLGVVLAYNLRFVLRWRKDYQLLDAAGNRRLTWKIAQGKRGWSQRTVWDARHARLRWWPPCCCGGAPILTIESSPCRWWSVVAKAVPPGIGSLLRPSKQMSRPGKLSLSLCAAFRSS